MSTEIPRMSDRVKALGQYEGDVTPENVITDVFQVIATLLQGSGGDYCACLSVPCECVCEFQSDLAALMAVRWPSLVPDQSNVGTNG